MPCDISAFPELQTTASYTQVGPMIRRTCYQCNTHRMTDTFVVDGLCPVGRVEKAVEDGLAAIKSAAPAPDLGTLADQIDEWLKPGSFIPAEPHTIIALVSEVARLRSIRDRMIQALQLVDAAHARRPV